MFKEDLLITKSHVLFFTFNITNVVRASASANKKSKTSEKRFADTFRRYEGQKLFTPVVEKGCVSTSRSLVNDGVLR